jgi:hypothetical protein
LVAGDITELSAGAVYVSPATPADIGIEPRLAEVGLKTKHVFVGRTTEATSREFIERDQIDFAAQGFQQLYQAPRIDRKIVHAG